MTADGSPGPGRLGVAAPAPRAVLLDALGTLVELVDPWAALARELAARGARVTEADARRALLAEMAYYRAHHDEAVDALTLEALRDRCAGVLRAALPEPASLQPPAVNRDALLAALRFRAFDDAAPALDALRTAGVRLVVVSNWDVSLHGVLRDTRLAERVDGVLTSAEERVAKPAPQIFARALERAGGIPAHRALHVGDSVDMDVVGARAAGIPAVLIARRGPEGGPEGLPAGVRVIRSLSEVVPGGLPTF